MAHELTFPCIQRYKVFTGGDGTVCDPTEIKQEEWLMELGETGSKQILK